MSGTPDTWPLRLWQEHARRLYRDPAVQTAAVLHHLDIRRRHAVTVEQALWFDALGRDLSEEAQL